MSPKGEGVRSSEVREVKRAHKEGNRVQPERMRPVSIPGTNLVSEDLCRVRFRWKQSRPSADTQRSQFSREGQRACKLGQST